ncbi:hypothetical protein GCM10027615_78120 [Plantactinospora veratri]
MWESKTPPDIFYEVAPPVQGGATRVSTRPVSTRGKGDRFPTTPTDTVTGQPPKLTAAEAIAARGSALRLMPIRPGCLPDQSRLCTALRISLSSVADSSSGRPANMPIAMLP